MPTDAPVMTATGAHDSSRVRGSPGAVTDYGLAEFDAIARRDSEQIGGAPHDVVLELADLAIGINHSHIISTMRGRPSSSTVSAS